MVALKDSCCGPVQILNQNEAMVPGTKSNGRMQGLESLCSLLFNIAAYPDFNSSSVWSLVGSPQPSLGYCAEFYPCRSSTKYHRPEKKGSQTKGQLMAVTA